MRYNNVPTLTIGDLKVNPPIIQGGMGVRVSTASLASAVAENGCVGVIATAGVALTKDSGKSEYSQSYELALRNEIKKAKSLTKGIIGVNIMVALNDYETLVKVAADEGVDIIICGAGLPLTLPSLIGDAKTKLVPVVSSARTFKIICNRWQSRYNRLPDAVIVEGPKAGGHLGYSHESVADGTAPSLESILVEVVTMANSFTPAIPVIAAGGIFDGNDIARVLKAGASGVQMATRFVCTDECDVHDNFKQAYINASAEDITIIKSPVGLPGRVINNNFVQQIKAGKTVPFKCSYQCLRTCEPHKAPYCIAQVLANAAKGKMDEAFAFAGSNAHRCTEVVPVKELIDKISEELSSAISKNEEAVHS